MRISDGSSDVCSSDLPSVLFLTLGPAAQGLHPVEAVLELFINTVRRLSEFCGVLSALALAAAVLVVCHMVVMRYVLGASTIWQTEFTLPERKRVVSGKCGLVRVGFSRRSSFKKKNTS